MTALRWRGHYASTSDRLAALRVADAMIRAHWPKVQVPCRIVIGPNELQATATLFYPGVLRVVLRHTGEPVAQSLPGRPLQLDAAAVARDREHWGCAPGAAARPAASLGMPTTEPDELDATLDRRDRAAAQCESAHARLSHELAAMPGADRARLLLGQLWTHGEARDVAADDALSVLQNVVLRLGSAAA